MTRNAFHNIVVYIPRFLTVCKIEQSLFLSYQKQSEVIYMNRQPQTVFLY